MCLRASSWEAVVIQGIEAALSSTEDPSQELQDWPLICTPLHTTLGLSSETDGGIFQRSSDHVMRNMLGDT